MFGHHHDGDEPTDAFRHFWHHLEETLMASEKLTKALADLATAAAAVEAERNNQAPDPRIAQLEAQVADLQGQLTTASDDAATATASDDAAAAQIETVVAQLTPPPAVPTPAAVLPEYTYSGDPTQPIDPAWTALGTSTPDGQALYTFSGDTLGQPATGDGLGGVWHLYTPPATA